MMSRSNCICRGGSTSRQLIPSSRKLSLCTNLLRTEYQIYSVKTRTRESNKKKNNNPVSEDLVIDAQIDSLSLAMEFLKRSVFHLDKKLIMATSAMNVYDPGNP